MHRSLFTVAFAVVLASQPLLGQNQNPPASGSGAIQDAGPAPQENPAIARQRRPLPQPTNLKVLPKDITPQELMRTMRAYAGALGVKCAFCHAVNPQTHKLDFASDSKDDKGIARTMILMTHTINAQFMSQVNDPDAMPEDKHVTCGTCHRGHTMPEHFMPRPETRQNPQEAPDADQKPH